MRIIVVGAGKTGTFLAERLQERHDVRLVEQRADRCALLRSMVPNVEIVEGDACEPEVLESAGVEGADLVIAATGDDEDNLVVAMLAKFYRTNRVFGRVNHPRNEWLFDSDWGVDVAVSSPSLMYGLVEKDLGFGDLITLLRLQENGVTLEELTIPSDSSIVGRPLSQVPLPGNVSVMAVLGTNGAVKAARGDTALDSGDQLLLLAEGLVDVEAIRAAFGISEDDGARDDA